jgi:hypothetical protein
VDPEAVPRPAVSDPDEKRWKSVSVRVTQADYDRLLRLAKAHDLPVSIYLRQLWRELDGVSPSLLTARPR